MSPSNLTTVQADVLNTVMPLVAAIVTSFRLYCRARQGHLWIDDLWATFAMLFILTLLIVNWIYMEAYEKYPQGTRVALYYMLIELFPAVVWCSRISILLTVVRLTAPGTLRKILIRTTMVFVILWAVLSAQVLWTCEDEPDWKTEPRPQCDFGKNVAIAQIITDVFGDTVLILAPFRLIYKVRLTKAQKIRILAIFSTSAITTVVSLVHAYYILSNEGLKEAMAAAVETSVSLIVANLNVVVAFFLRMSAKDDTPSPVPWQSSPVITIGSLPIRRHRFNDPLATTTIGIDTTTIRLTNLPEACPSALKSDNTDEISLNNIEGKQGGGELWGA
ncbi:uncharacterized protein F5147DRAFT_704035 [Suillus discolor]|uniref:Rhodopsin domain-containing protein n=1 Tax=Suillus discolor TaxID=1912936 RepID=A0A9P7F4J7_9AGAM|nr:uncharacterized protein F5147DRAFT_704035 [Suillus discolor]KAG2104354.1 hypothetical protein F5147DRAFT_704035 [Suillus discolor]